MRRAAAALALGLLAATIATTASAQRRTDAPSILGAWRFETARYDVTQSGGCQMKGSMTIVRGRDANTFTCRFIATESCNWGEWSAEQTCTATRQGDKLEITSTVVRLTPNNISYAPDNWSLTIRSTDLMVGELRSADIANVQFRRGPAIIS
jgi:hypothetical protein